MCLAMNPEMKIQIAREDGATFAEDVTQVEDFTHRNNNYQT